MAGADQETARGAMETLAQRIAGAARLAVALHLVTAQSETIQQFGRQASIGGAGGVAPATADRGHSRRPFGIHHGAAEGAD